MKCSYDPKEMTGAPIGDPLSDQPLSKPARVLQMRPLQDAANQLGCPRQWRHGGFRLAG